ncbi:helix-turn-helix domain-containing protein [Paractinoplanes atraurantiacus]|uniref:GAF domain-containing protein n=1 Tax=Paractinoplanes atraurantiacus TaxID=1036182 RepID=A0A285JME9_9ACTN|nr:helix-turn-helix domain-containing protein [Actinoplanes atraurantiacus]SNY61253.1 GAF domain-containing protein [Actinoplanes atraurantiacus]
MLDFFDLLAREATAAEFEQPVLAARAAGASAPEIAELEKAKLRALHVRAMLERRRRREEELSALYDTASDLAGLRDVDAVLRAIVHRARTLLNADVSYMTLNDTTRGDTYMRITDGSVAASFQSLRLAPGAGLGGLVALRGTPYVTANYATDARFEHTTDIDKGVGDEGLVAILGVPLKLGAEVIGVLFAANRTERPFAREEVALLVSLAAHAAVAIDAARLLTETRAALADLSTANEAVERAAAAHDRLTTLVLRGGGVEDVAHDLVDVLDGTLLVFDATGRRLAAAPPSLISPDPKMVAEAVAASRADGRSVQRGSLYVAAVVAGTDDLGALVFEPARPLSEADQRTLERAAQITALLLLFRRTVAEAEAQVRDELLDDLISHPSRDPAALRSRAARLGVDLDAPHVVVVADGTQITSWSRTFAASRSGLAMTREGRTTLLLPGTDPGQAARTVAKEAHRELGRPVTAGAAGPVTTPAADTPRPTAGTAGPATTVGAAGPDAEPLTVASAHREAERCARALVALGRTGVGASADELGYVGLLLGGGPQPDVPGFVTTMLGPVIAYDERRGTALVQTLDAYFAAGGGLARAAEELHVHVNTVSQRLDRVTQLLGAGWQEPDRSLDLRLALRLHRLSM